MAITQRNNSNSSKFQSMNNDDVDDNIMIIRSSDSSSSSYSNPEEEEEEITIDEAVDKISTGRFQNQLLFAAGTAFMADAVEIMLLSFLAPLLKHEWNWDDHVNDNDNDNDINGADSKAATITSCMFIGALLGTSILGPLADRIGRRPVLFWATSIISIFGFLTAFCNNFQSLVYMRFAVGFGIGGLTIPFDILAEFVPNRERGRYLLLMEYFWTVGSVLVPILAYVTLEKLDSWRVFVAACAMPCVFSLIAGMVYVPESPRWLILQGRNGEALDILRKAAMTNGKDANMLFPPNCRLCDVRTCTTALSDRTNEYSNSSSSSPLTTTTTTVVAAVEKEKKSGFRELFKPRWRRITLLLFVVWWGYAFCYYGTIIVSTRVFQNFNDGANQQQQQQQQQEQQGGELLFDYSAIFISSSAEAVGTAIAIFLIDRVGRVKIVTGSFLGGGIFLFSLCLLVNTLGRSGLVALSFAARACEMIASSTAWIQTVEIFSTDIRSTGHSATNAMSRIGGFMSPYLVSGQWSFSTIAFVMIVLHFVIALCAALLPETKDVDMGVVDDGANSGYRDVSSSSSSSESLNHSSSRQKGSDGSSEEAWSGMATQLT